VSLILSPLVKAPPKPKRKGKNRDGKKPKGQTDTSKAIGKSKRVAESNQGDTDIEEDDDQHMSKRQKTSMSHAAPLRRTGQESFHLSGNIHTYTYDRDLFKT
jgi:hypothetical protein